MFESYEEARIYPGDRRGQRQLDALLEKEIGRASCRERVFINV